MNLSDEEVRTWKLLKVFFSFEKKNRLTVSHALQCRRLHYNHPFTFSGLFGPVHWVYVICARLS